jgi:entericidin B
MKIIATALFAAMLATLAGCNTVAGAGKDTQAAGSAVERAAEKAKP